MTAKKTQDAPELIKAPENNDCFIIMPIADHPDYKQGHFKRVYEDIIKPACQAAGYRAIRADDVAQTNLIHLDILQKLLESPMAICDLSTRNPNVLFELGLRQAFDKPTILIQEVGTPQIFDINLFRYTQYRNGLDYRDVLADQKAIQKVIEETKQAVAENKSVNSIIKLLSITNPASLQDSSNFEDKEYFQILMSEIQGIKNSLARNNNFTNSKYIINPENERKSSTQIKVRVLVDNEMPLETLEVLMTYISTLADDPTLTLMEDKELNNFITFNCKPEVTEEIIEKIRDFASLNNIEIKNIRKSIFPKKIIS
ncbi:hypothetical protein EA709_16665 [Acinetobacter baumannii]|uniref:hypothetical protein n=1 Tax=Acinetobacter baumannii TaxID=470 RepID=UPI0002B95EBA|nr:hypothetical protein [Acinetobacter baumannii]RSQ24223.1 hypothetical protein EA709_16665 [Acinetobacter baumannii]